MSSITFRDLVHTAKNNPKKLGYFADTFIILECLDEILGEDVDGPQRVETLECQLIQELTKGCIKV